EPREFSWRLNGAILAFSISISSQCPQGSEKPRTLSTDHRANIRAEKLTPVRRTEDLPATVREALRERFRTDHHRADLQGTLANRAAVQGPQAESPREDVRGDLGQRAAYSDLDGSACT